MEKPTKFSMALAACCIFTVITMMIVESMDCRLLTQKHKLMNSIRQNSVNYTGRHLTSIMYRSGDQPSETASTMDSPKTDFKVPNIVHYIWYENTPVFFRFDKVLSVLSAIKNIKPEFVYFHTNMEPYGQYFEMLKNISIFKVVHRKPPTSVIKKTFHETDYSNYDKVKIIMEQGGIYLDLDVMVTQSFDDLRRYECTIGFEHEHKICSGVIVCVKSHTFLYLWLNYYYEDFRREWSYNSGIVSTRVAERFPELVHAEKKKIHRPNFGELDQIWGKTPYPWRENYTVHTWIRVALKKMLKEYPSPESIKTMDSTYGQMARDVYYGSSDIING